MTMTRNADGDSIEDMRAVQDRFKGRGIDWYKISDEWFDDDGWDLDDPDDTVDNFRITAKHADEFDLATMDFETWARAAIGRGRVLRSEGPDFSSGDHCTNHFAAIYGRSMEAKDGHRWPLVCGHKDWHWTAITPEQHGDEVTEAGRIKEANAERSSPSAGAGG